MVFRDTEIRNKTLKKGEIYKRCTLIDCTNEGALLDECIVSNAYSAPQYNPQNEGLNESSDSNF